MIVQFCSFEHTFGPSPSRLNAKVPVRFGVEYMALQIASEMALIMHTLESDWRETLRDQSEETLSCVLVASPSPGTTF